MLKLFRSPLRNFLDFILSTMHFFFSGLAKRSVSPPMTDWGRVLLYLQKSLPRVCGKKKTHECANDGNGMNKKNTSSLAHYTAGLDRLNKQTFDFHLATAEFSRYAKTLSRCRLRQAAIKHPFLLPVFLSPLWEEG